MGLAELKADAKLLRERLVTIDSNKLDAKHELVENIVPLIEGLIEALQEGLEADVADLGEAVDTLIDQDTDVLHPETAGKIIGVLEIGKLLANELETILPKLDDMKRKRVKSIIKGYRQGAEVIGEIITEITIPDDPEEGEPDGEESGPDNDSEPGEPGEREGDDDDEVVADGGEA